MRCRGRLQCHGHGVTWTKSGGSLQFLFSEIQLKNSSAISRPAGTLKLYLVLWDLAWGGGDGGNLKLNLKLYGLYEIVMALF